MTSETSLVRCYAKLRPSLQKEPGGSDIKTTGDKITITTQGADSSYNFDGIYGPDIKAKQIFKEKCEPLLHRLVEGTNISVVAVGQTGSGKSYLMNGTHENPGIAPCMIEGLFQVIERMKNKEFFVTASYIDVIDDSLIDLLNPHTGQMKIRSTPQWNVFVDGLSELVVQDAAQLAQYYEQGTRARKMGTTEARAHRERASSIFIVRTEQREPGRGTIGLRSCLTLVDLAGLESGACSQLVECIKALNEKRLVPYRESKLSSLLQDTFGGNCLTSVICLLNPRGNDNVETLKMSQLIRGLKHSISINMDETEMVISNLRDEISILREKVTKNTSNRDDIIRLQNLVKELQLAKQQTWEEKQKLSRKYEEERRANLANRGILDWVMDTKLKGQQQIMDKINALQRDKERLTNEYKIKKEEVSSLGSQLQKLITEYSNQSEKRSDAENKAKITSIHKLKDKLQESKDELQSLKLQLQDTHERLRSERDEANSKNMVTKGNAEIYCLVELEERQRMESENASLISAELDKMKLDVEHDTAEIRLKLKDNKTYTAQEYADLEIKVTELTHEKPVVSLQIQTLKQEKIHLQQALQEVQKLYKAELEKQQLLHFQTFRNYREMFEKQKVALEKRYGNLLESAIQDAVFLSSRNSELIEENGSLRLELDSLKDRISRSGGK